ncbi:hypothetical protein [Bounagaea algeriensis]
MTVTRTAGSDDLNPGKRAALASRLGVRVSSGPRRRVSSLTRIALPVDIDC